MKHRLEEHGIDSIVTSEKEPDLAVITYLESSLVKKLSQSRAHQRRHNRRSDRRQSFYGQAYHLPTINLGRTV